MFDESSRRTADLFLVSFLILFMELACIRWFGSMVVFLTFFTNIVLLAAFLGISVGCLAASQPAEPDRYRHADPARRHDPRLRRALRVHEIQRRHDRRRRPGIAAADLLRHRVSRPRSSRFVVPLEAVAGVFFVLVALTFVGLGQVMGRAFTTLPNRMVAYTVNIAGSLAGIAGFALVSYERAPPSVWFAVSLGLCLYFLTRRTLLQVYAQIARARAAGARRQRAAGRPGRSGRRTTRSRISPHVAPLPRTTSAISRWSTSTRRGAGLRAAAPAQPRRRRPGLRRRADHRRRLRQRRRGGAAPRRARTSTRSRSIRRSTSSAAGITRTCRTPTRA